MKFSNLRGIVKQIWPPLLWGYVRRLVRGTFQLPLLNRNHLLKRVSRYAKGVLLTPRRVKEIAERIGSLDSSFAGIREAILSSNGRSDLQRYSGYSDEDMSLFNHFHVHEVLPERGFIKDFLGTRIRTTCVHSLSRHLDGTVLGLPLPGDFHSEAVEWIGLLKSVLSAKESYRAMELGAGWAPWLVAGAMAARNRGIAKIFLCGVEADPGRFGLMQQHFRDNGLDPSQHALLLAGVGARNGKVRWPKGVSPTEDMGTRPVRATDVPGGIASNENTDYRGFCFSDYMDVEMISFSNLLERQCFWDLVHIDVQGWESEICAAATESLNQRVRWLIIGTHSRKLDGDLVDLFYRNGWVLENEKPCRFNYTTTPVSLEGMTTADGVQVWRNPRLC